MIQGKGTPVNVNNNTEPIMGGWNPKKGKVHTHGPAHKTASPIKPNKTPVFIGKGGK